MNKSIIISYKEDTEERKHNLKNLLTWISYVQDGTFEVIIVEQDDVSKLDWLNEVKGYEFINHMFVKNDGIFNVGWGYNIGALNAKTNVLIFNSVDIIVKHIMYTNAEQISKMSDIIKVYKNIIELDKPDTEIFIRNNYTIQSNTKHVAITDNSVSNGVFIMKKELFLVLKGFDENCYGHGYQDVIFNKKLSIMEFETKILNDNAVKLHTNPNKKGTYYYFNNANKELFNEYNEMSKDDLIWKINDTKIWGDPDITKSNDISIKHIKREIYEQATEEVLTMFSDRLTDEYINHLTDKIFNVMYDVVVEEIKKKIEEEFKDIKLNKKKKKNLVRKIIDKFNS